MDLPRPCRQSKELNGRVAVIHDSRRIGCQDLPIEFLFAVIPDAVEVRPVEKSRRIYEAIHDNLGM